ncbi:MAG: M20/M25/M40 family metallo-hydrolase [Clostridia bacterium]
MELSELTQLNGVSGNEQAVRAAILREAAQCCDRTHVDKMGNLLAFKAGTRPGSGHVLLLSHMDEVGLMALGVTDEGLIAYDPVGGIDPRVLVSKRVTVGEKGIPGVIGAKAIHLQTREERATPLTHRDLSVDIGAKDKASAELLVKPGDYIALAGEYLAFGEGFVRAKALDDRVGCYNLLRLMRERFTCDVTYAFTVQEEVGLRGAGVVARQVDAVRCALILEGTTANDLGHVPEHLQVTRAGAGVALSFMDRTTIAHPGLLRALKACAQREGIAWQFKQFVAGGNDAGAVQGAKGPLAVASLSVPCRYIHSPSSVCSLMDVEAQYALARAFLVEGAAFESEERG